MSKTLSLGIVVGAALSSGFTSTFNSAEKQTLQLGKAMRETDAKLKAVRGIRDYETQLEKLRAEQKQSGGSNKVLAKEISRTEKELLRAQKAAEKYGISLDKLGDEEKRLAKEQAKNKFRAAGQKVGGAVGSGIGFAGRALGGALTAGAGMATGALAIGKQMADKVEALENVSSRLGMTTQAYQELQLAAQNAGIEQATFDTATEKMVGNISEVAATGKGAAADALGELGLSAEQMAKMSPDEQMNAVADAMDGVKNAGDKIRLSKDIFGKSGAAMIDLLGSGGAEKLKKDREEIFETGVVLTEQQKADARAFDQAMDKAGNIVEGLGNKLGGALIPQLTVMIQKTSAFATKHGPQFQAIGEVLGATFTGVGNILGGVFSVLESIGTSIGETLGWIESKSGLISGIADFFSDDDPEKNPNIVTDGAAISSRKPPGESLLRPEFSDGTLSIPKPTLGNKPSAVTNNTSASFVIHQQPGQSSKELADDVVKKINQQKKINRNSALYDDDEDTD